MGPGVPRAEIEQILRENYLVDVTKIKNLLEITTIQRQFLLSQRTVQKLLAFILVFPFVPLDAITAPFLPLVLADGKKK